MPITRVENDQIEVGCAACGAERTVAVCDVRVQPSEQDASGSRLELPPCGRCRSVETLIPVARDGSHAREPSAHALLVDLIAARCGCAETSEELAEEEIAAAFPDSIPEPPTRTAK